MDEGNVSNQDDGFICTRNTRQLWSLTEIFTIGYVISTARLSALDNIFNIVMVFCWTIGRDRIQIPQWFFSKRLFCCTLNDCKTVRVILFFRFSIDYFIEHIRNITIVNDTSLLKDFKCNGIVIPTSACRYSFFKYNRAVGEIV